MKRFADRYRRKSPILKIGDQVFLSLEHLTTTRPSKKIDYQWDGPFEVSEVINTHAYRVKIPTESGRPPHNVFHISQVRKVEDNTGTQSTTVSNPPKRLARRISQPKPFVTTIHPEDVEYEVSNIVDSRRRKRKIEYLVNWTGYGEDEQQWEPERHLENALDVVLSFHKQQPRKPKGKIHAKAVKQLSKLNDIPPRIIVEDSAHSEL